MKTDWSEGNELLSSRSFITLHDLDEVKEEFSASMLLLGLSYVTADFLQYLHNIPGHLYPVF